MFDTMVITKAVAAFCGALLVFLLTVWAADVLFQPRNHAAAPAFVIDTGEDVSDAEPEEELTFDEAFEIADIDAGGRLWSECRACHAMEPDRHGVGPSLHGVVGRDIGAIDGFRYSGALDQAGEVWTPEILSAFLENPNDVTPGTSMSYRGMPDVRNRANLIAWIEAESQ